MLFGIYLIQDHMVNSIMVVFSESYLQSFEKHAIELALPFFIAP